jgi:general stress protein YciG
MATSDRGFASMSKEQRTRIARMGGQASHKGGFSDKNLAKKAGEMGGSKSRRS